MKGDDLLRNWSTESVCYGDGKADKDQIIKNLCMWHLKSLDPILDDCYYFYQIIIGKSYEHIYILWQQDWLEGADYIKDTT